MGQYYYVNKTLGTFRVPLVHTADCPQLSSLDQRLFLGTFYAQLDAVKQAKKYYPQAELCERCCPQPKPKKRFRNLLSENPPLSC